MKRIKSLNGKCQSENARMRDVPGLVCVMTAISRVRGSPEPEPVSGAECTFGNVLICPCHLGKLLLWVWWLNFSKLVQPRVDISQHYNRQILRNQNEWISVLCSVCMSLAELCSGKKDYEGAAKSRKFHFKELLLTRVVSVLWKVWLSEEYLM